ncbi:TPA: DUF362 domain-containing protein, partial [Candidatus Bathyarchaeota archaeon]|nr:DUF362 domain-containing protein [Candidatus Bathyarchaeota archaeon]
MIKPNVVVDQNRLAVTHVDALRALLDFIDEFDPDQVMIAEGSGDPLSRFRSFGYLELGREYPVEFVDLNKGGYEEIRLLTADFGETGAGCPRSRLGATVEPRSP